MTSGERLPVWPTTWASWSRNNGSQLASLSSRRMPRAGFTAIATIWQASCWTKPIPCRTSARRQYNEAGELSGVKEPTGDLADYEYDGAGRIGQVVLPGGGRDRYEYDALGNVAKATDPLDHQWRSSYNAAGQLVNVTDPKGHATRFAYDQAGRLIQKRLSDSTVISYAYDAGGQLASVDDGSFPIHYTRRRRGTPDASRVSGPQVGFAYEYDAEGRLTRFVDTQGSATAYEYDPSIGSRRWLPPMADASVSATTFAIGSQKSLTRMGCAERGNTIWPTGP